MPQAPPKLKFNDIWAFVALKDMNGFEKKKNYMQVIMPST